MMAAEFRLVLEAVSQADCRAVLEANPPATMAPPTVQTPHGRQVRPGYRDGLLSTPTNPAEPLERIRQATARLAGVPVANLEPLQLLSYEPGEDFQLHHDQPQAGEMAAYMERFGGRRVATVLIGLAADHTGGGCSFPDLGLTIDPPPGAAAVWLNHRRETRHQATGPTAGRRAVLVCFARSEPYREE